MFCSDGWWRYQVPSHLSPKYSLHLFIVRRRHDKDNDKYMKTDAKTGERKYKSKINKDNNSEKGCYHPMSILQKLKTKNVVGFDLSVCSEKDSL